MAPLSDGHATPWPDSNVSVMGRPLQKNDPSGGTTGRVGTARSWMGRSRRTLHLNSVEHQELHVRTRSIGLPVASGLRASGERCRIEFIDIREQFAESGRTMIEQLPAFLRRGLGRVAGCTAWMKVLGLPGERRRPVHGKLAIILFHRDA